MKKGVPVMPRPAIVVIHGGGWIEGDKSSFASREHGVPGNIVDFAALGFVAVTINYRLAGEAPFPAALDDCKCAVRWLRAHAKDYHLDPEHIGAFGNSAGGHLALLLGMAGKDARLEGDGTYQDQSSLVQAVVSDSGPIDLARAVSEAVPCVRCALGSWAVRPRASEPPLYQTASPINHISPRDTPASIDLWRRRCPGPGRDGRPVRARAGPGRRARRQLPPPRPRRSLPVFAGSRNRHADGRQ